MDRQTQVTAALNSHIPVLAMSAPLCQLLPAKVITENYLFATGWQLGLPVSDTNINFHRDECGRAAGTGHGGQLSTTPRVPPVGQRQHIPGLHKLLLIPAATSPHSWVLQAEAAGSPCSAEPGVLLGG